MVGNRWRSSFSIRNPVSADVASLMAGEAPQEEVLARLLHWRQEASVLNEESLLASGYVSLALQQVLADLYDQQHAFLRDERGVDEVASLYQDTLDYLDLVQANIEDKEIVQQLETRRQVMSRRGLYLSDPLHLLEKMEEVTTHYGFVHREEMVLVKVQELLASAGHQEEAFTLLVSLFDEVADKLSQSSYRNHLDSVANNRLRHLLGEASRQYRLCREGQDEAFVKRYQVTLRSLLRRPVYQFHGFFDLLRGVKAGAR